MVKGERKVGMYCAALVSMVCVFVWCMCCMKVCCNGYAVSVLCCMSEGVWVKFVGTCSHCSLQFLVNTGCPIKNGTVDFQYIASGKLSIFLRHRIKYFPQKRMTPKSLNLMK